LTAEHLRSHLKWWNCTLPAFVQWLVLHNEQALLAGTEMPDYQPESTLVDTLPDLRDMVEYITHQYNLLSVMCLDPIVRADGAVVGVGLLHIAVPNKKNSTFMVDLRTLLPPHDPTAWADVLPEIRLILADPEIRKCVWRFHSWMRVWTEQLGIPRRASWTTTLSAGIACLT